MGQKVNPVGIRLALNKAWLSTWYAKGKEYASFLAQDNALRKYIMKHLDKAAASSVSQIAIERFTDRVKIIISTARSAMLIGHKGENIEALKRRLTKLSNSPVYIDVQEVPKPELCALLVANNVAQQLERRVMFRRAMKRAVQAVLRAGAGGVKIAVSGRLGGAEIARTEWYREGKVPLHTFRAHIDYATVEAKTTYGIIGVKVWIYMGEVFKDKGTSINSSTAKQQQHDNRAAV